FILPMYLNSPSGGFKVVYEYANRLQKRGHKLSVVHPRNIEPQNKRFDRIKSLVWPYKLKIKNRPLIGWFPMEPDVDLLLVPDLQERFMPESDCIVATAFNTAFPVDSYSQDKGRKFYLIQAYEDWNGSTDRVRESWLLPLHKIVISRWLLEIAQGLGERDRTDYIPIGMDFAHFEITSPMEQRKLPRVGMLAHPNEIKGFHDGIAALELAKREMPDLQAVLFGTHPRPEMAPDWIEYEYRPSPKRLAALYNSCQAYLHPSWTEGWGLTAAEAMACGCALISAD